MSEQPELTAGSNSFQSSTATSQTWPPELNSDAPRAPALIGDYQLLEQIGVGGMGIVYRAQQLHPVRRIVALKLVKLGMDTPAVVARFGAERQALALLEHPGIARVYDAGATDTGRPYFVMEYVPGSTITEYCHSHGLTTRRRLELFEQVCHAVQYAHYKGILHRDLKPSNILVTEIDGEPKPKVIDFGIARAIEPQTGATLLTRPQELLGTPAYMSPEQCLGQDLDTRSDVYSLGVVLYELLTGLLPYDPADLKAASDPTQLRAIMLRENLPRPSLRVSTCYSQSRSDVESVALSRQLRGDLDRLVMKALDPQRQPRYGTAAELAEDVRRYLSDEPISAQPPTLMYQAKKFTRRNRVLVSASALVLLAVLVGSGVAVVGLVRARRALSREAAAHAAEKSQRQAADMVSLFLGNMLGSVDPSVAQGKPVLVRDVLDRAAPEVDTRFANQPVVAASLHAIIADTYRDLALFEQAEQHARAALDLRRKALGADDDQTLTAMNILATSLRSLGRNAESEKLLDDLVQRRRRVSGPDARDTVAAEQSLVLVLLDLGRPKEAEPLMRHALEASRRNQGDTHEDTLAAMTNMATVESALGRHKDAEDLNRSVLEVRQRVLGPDHPWTMLSQRNLTVNLLRQNRPAEAEPILRDLVARSERVLGPDHRDTLSITNSLAAALRQLNKMDECESVLRRVADGARKSLPPGNPFTLKAISNLGVVLEQRNKPQEALACFQELWNKLPSTQSAPRDAATYVAEYALCLVKLNQFDKAEQPLLDAQRRLESAGMSSGDKMREVRAGLVQYYERTGRPEEAARWRSAATMPSSSPSR